jgi:hypothetical protein
MIKDEDAITAAQRLCQEACLRLKVKPRETVGEIAFAEGLKLAVLFDSDGKLAAFYRIGDNAVSDFDGAETVRLRPRLANRKVR